MSSQFKAEASQGVTWMLSPRSPQDVLMTRGAGHLAGWESPGREVTAVRRLMAQPQPPACGGDQASPRGSELA